METLSILAQVFISPLLGTIYDHYVPPILEKIGIKWDVTEEMKKLSDIKRTIQNIIEDSEDVTTNKLIHDFLRELKEIDYDVEDLLDEFATEALHDPESTGITDKSSLVKRIKQVIDKFDKTAEQRSELFNLTSKKRVGDRPDSSRVDPERETSALPPTDIVIGRDDEIKNIVKLLVNNSNAGKLSIYAIVGIGGLGKTTLAQMVYNHNIVKSHFQIQRWVCVSENFEVRSLMGDMILSGSYNNSQSLDQLQRRLQEELSGKRFLLVLDDVWNEDAEKWDKLKSSLKCGAEGSSIIVTTRSDKVASLMTTLPVCRPNFLSEEDCFSLFKHRAFAEGEGNPKLEPIGKEIVKRCGGVPLAAKALGGLLRFKREEQEWTDVQKSKLWDLEASILPALLLSYKHLPQHLRQCFAYCSIFPKDYRMEKELLIQLWMANDFLQPKGNMELEDIGNGVFNDLLWRGLFQEVHIFNDTKLSCKMHDLVHDLACSITRDECFSVVTNADEELVIGRCKSTRHLAIHDHHILFSPDFSLSMFESFLRTLLLPLDVYSDRPLPSLNFSNFIYLRVLDLSGSKRLKTLPESIARMKLLRYLDLSRTGIVVLPGEVFGNLINLQTLKLRRCYYLEMLPGNMRKLTKLRHLDITGSTGKLLGMPVGMGQLKCLHVLSDFIVSEDCGVGELQELDHLGGTLAITYLWKVKDIRDAENAKLSRKENIRDLRFDWSDKCNSAPVPELSQTNSINDKKLIADALQPHPNIARLEFRSYGGSDFPRWMNSTCLFSLVKLSLVSCRKCKHLPTLGLLPHLKELSLWRIGVTCIGNEFYFDEGGNNRMKTRGGGGMVLFPALEQLVFRNMPSLEEWKGWSSSSALPLPSSSTRMEEGETQVSVFPVLKTLKIRDCPNLRTLPPLKCSEKIFVGMVVLQNLTSLQKLKIRSCPMLVSLPEGTQGLTSLKFLKIQGCDGLKTLNNCLQLLTNLQELMISECQELESLSDDFQNLIALQKLEISDCPMLVNLPIGTQSLTSLQELKIRDCPMIVNLPWRIQSLTSLKILTIRNCDGLKSLNNCLQLLNNLHELAISECQELDLLPDDFQNQTSLKILTIERCDGLKSLNKCLQLLTNLQQLVISECPELELLPDDFQNLVSLGSLYLDDLPKLVDVPVLESSQRSLKDLKLHDCKNLKSLPDGLQHLTALRDLQIVRCHPELHRRCQENTGLDWHKIAHIPILCNIGWMISPPSSSDESD